MKKYIVLVFCFALLLSGCIKLDSPEVSFVEAKVSKVTLLGAQVDFLFNIKNTNPIPIDISGYSYDVLINGKKILSDTGDGFSVGANSTGRFAFPVFVRYDQFLSAVSDVAISILSGKMEFDYQIIGKVSGGSSGLTITQDFGSSGTIKIPKELLQK